MPPNHLILCQPLLLLLSIFPSIRVFSNESALCIRWPKYCSMRPSNEYSEMIFRMDWFEPLQSKGLPRVFSSTTDWKHQFFSAQPSLRSNSHIHTSVVRYIWCQVYHINHMCSSVALNIHSSIGIHRGLATRNWCFWIVVLEKTLESPLDWLQGDQSSQS